MAHYDMNHINPKDNIGVTHQCIFTGSRKETREQEKWFQSQA